VTTWQDWITDLIATRYRTKAAFARAVGRDYHVFLRGVKKGSFRIDRLLSLAQITSTHPSLVLRLAGKGDLADQIEALYGPSDLTLDERRHLDRWRHLGRLRPRMQERADAVIDELIALVEAERDAPVVAEKRPKRKRTA
jgi:hypothetical protein